jgi:triacylglycerol lipase
MSLRTAARHAGPVLLLSVLTACSPDALTGPTGAALGARKPTPPPPTYATLTVTHTPVLFVHGWNSSAGTWTGMLGRFRAAGYLDTELAAFSYTSSQSNATTAGLIALKVDSIRNATGSERVAIVTHSMGALSARYYTRNLGGDGKVDAVVSLGGPNHGTNTALFCAQTACVEMRPNSSFLSALNTKDETWGAPRYATWWSSCDQVILPQSSTPLSGGATNTQTACMQHSDLQNDATVFGQVRAWVDTPPAPRLLAGG